ncbi:aldo/keto reductase [Corallincola platygyrae]|uniref:Aldo/keto reductase n=1 Tax=Corallincola platygyrae TaxID=1193278 RepID=A0ABW4XPI7_9GAMM
MKRRQLGNNGLEVSSVGLGCMGMSDFYGSSDEMQNMEVLTHALDIGVSFWDTADIYGPHTNELLLGQFFKQNPSARQQVQLATKFGVARTTEGEFVGVNGRPEYVKLACDASLKRLGVDHIDLYYQHRIDQSVPIEETVGAMADLVKAGKVRYLGLSEASHRTIQRAHQVHPISAVQMEYSLWSREVETEVLPTCQKLGIGLVPYSPLGRGFLTGAIRQREDLQSDDWRLNNPRFEEASLQKNLALVDAVMHLAEVKGCTPAQLALAWLLAQDPAIVPIPGTRKISRLNENTGASGIVLSNQELTSLTNAISDLSVSGARYPVDHHSSLFADTPEPVEE